eukprot:1671890-Alexandrium_andersonii.AAC.1
MCATLASALDRLRRARDAADVLLRWHTAPVVAEALLTGALQWDLRPFAGCQVPCGPAASLLLRADGHRLA